VHIFHPPAGSSADQFDSAKPHPAISWAWLLPAANLTCLHKLRQGGELLSKRPPKRRSHYSNQGGRPQALPGRAGLQTKGQGQCAIQGRIIGQSLCIRGSAAHARVTAGPILASTMESAPVFHCRCRILLPATAPSSVMSRQLPAQAQ